MYLVAVQVVPNGLDVGELQLGAQLALGVQEPVLQVENDVLVGLQVLRALLPPGAVRLRLELGAFGQRGERVDARTRGRELTVEVARVELRMFRPGLLLDHLANEVRVGVEALEGLQ